MENCLVIYLDVAKQFELLTLKLMGICFGFTKFCLTNNFHGTNYVRKSMGGQALFRPLRTGYCLSFPISFGIMGPTSLSTVLYLRFSYFEAGYCDWRCFIIFCLKKVWDITLNGQRMPPYTFLLIIFHIFPYIIIVLLCSI